jgi:hypothetical protein
VIASHDYLSLSLNNMKIILLKSTENSDNWQKRSCMHNIIWIGHKWRHNRKHKIIYNTINNIPKEYSHIATSESITLWGISNTVGAPGSRVRILFGCLWFSLFTSTSTRILWCFGCIRLARELRSCGRMWLLVRVFIPCHSLWIPWPSRGLSIMLNFLFSLCVFYSLLDCMKKQVQCRWRSEFPFHEKFIWCDSCCCMRCDSIFEKKFWVFLEWSFLAFVLSPFLTVWTARSAYPLLNGW